MISWVVNKFAGGQRPCRPLHWWFLIQNGIEISRKFSIALKQILMWLLSHTNFCMLYDAQKWIQFRDWIAAIRHFNRIWVKNRKWNVPLGQLPKEDHLVPDSIKIEARFLSLARSKLRLCSANHRPGYWSNLPCDWPSTAWAYSEQQTENGTRQPTHHLNTACPLQFILCCQNKIFIFKQPLGSKLDLSIFLHLSGI